MLNFLEKFKEKYNLSFLEELLPHKEMGIYVFGGAIRDIILEREWKEIDLRVVYNKDWEEREAVIESSLRRYNLEGKSRIENLNLTVYRFLPPRSASDAPIDLSLVPTIKDNLPDFTINSIFYNLASQEMLDSYQGLVDLKNRVIRTVKDPDIQFKEEPHMIFRALKFACQLDFEIEHNTLQAMIKNQAEVQKTFQFIKNNQAGILTELFLGNIFKGLKDDPKKYFTYLNATGVFVQLVEFYRQESALSLLDEAKIEVLDKGSYEKNISYLLSSVINILSSEDRQLHFDRLSKLLAISTPKQYTDFVINPKLLAID